MTGRVLRIDPRGFGFLMGEDQVERFFHCREVKNYPFESLIKDTPVEFESKKVPFKGLRAVNVRVISAADHQVAA